MLMCCKQCGQSKDGVLSPSGGMVRKSEVFDDKLGSTNNTIFVTICQQSALLYAWLHVCYLSNDQDFNKKHPYILRTFYSIWYIHCQVKHQGGGWVET